MDNKDTGLLLDKQNILLHRMWFKQMVALHGIKLIYRAPRESKDYTRHGELDAQYQEPIEVGCIFEEHPTQSTMKKMGWNSELIENALIVHVPYDTPDLQVGSLFIVPSGIDGDTGKVFKVIKMQTTYVYPSEITCELGPFLKSELEPSQVNDFSKSNFNLMIEERDEE